MMKTRLVMAAALASLAALPATAQDVSTKRMPPAQQASASTAGQQASDAVLQELATAASKNSVQPAQLDRLRQALEKEGNDSPRLEAAIASVSERAKEGNLTADDVRRLHTDVIDVRFDNAFQKLERQAAARGASEEQFDQLAALLVQRAQAAQGIDLDIGANQTRLKAAIDKLKTQYQSGSTTPADFQALRAQFAQARYEGAMKSLEQSATQGRASRADFARVRAILKDEGALEGSGSRLEQALAKLEARALEGEAISPEEFAQLKGQAIKSAREAAAAKSGATKPAEGDAQRGKDAGQGGDAKRGDEAKGGGDARQGGDGGGR